MYWRWNRIPELADLPPKERKRLWKEARRDPLRPKDVFYISTIFVVYAVAGFTVLSLTKSMSACISLPVFIGILFGVGAVADALLILRYRPVVRRLRDAILPS